MAQQNFLHFPRIDVAAARDDYVFGAVLEREQALVVERADGEKAATAEFPPATTVAALLSAKNGHLRTTGLDGHTPQLVSYRQLNDYPLVVAVGQSEDHALADSQSREAVYVRWRLMEGLDDIGITLQYAENSAQMQPIREQSGAFADSIKLWSAS